LAFYHKYRAKTFGEMVGQEHITATLLQSLKSGTTVHSYVLTGPKGIGKTSVARLIAKSLNCLDSKDGEPCNKCESCLEINRGGAIDVIEIDAASNTGVENIREVIEQSKLAPIKSKYKVYIIDEVHMLSKSAFNALLKTLEEPGERIVFVMATTEIQKIPETVLSRSQRFDFRRATVAELVENLKRVAKNEKIAVDDKSLEEIAIMAYGAHRDAVSLLEKVAASGKQIDIETTRAVLGLTDKGWAYRYIGAIFNSKTEEGLKIAQEMFDSGFDVVEFVRTVIKQLREIMVYKISGQGSSDKTSDDLKVVEKLSTETTVSDLISIIEIHLEAMKMMREIPFPNIALEIAVVKAGGGKPGARSQESGDRPSPSLPVGRQGYGRQAGVRSQESGDRRQETEHGSREIEQRVQEIAESAKKVEPIVSETVDCVLSTAEPQPLTPDPGSALSSQLSAPTVAVPVLEMSLTVWQEIVSEVNKENSTLTALLRDAKPLKIDGNMLTLGVKFKFHKDKIAEKKNCLALEKSIEKILGQSFFVTCEVMDKEIKLQDGTTDDDLQKAAEEIFS